MRILLIEIPPPVVKMKSAENGTPSPFQFDAPSPLASFTNEYLDLGLVIQILQFYRIHEELLIFRNFLSRNLPHSFLTVTLDSVALFFFHSLP